MSNSSADIEVLREMVRLAENRRAEEFARVEKVDQHNLALIAFSGAFLSLLVTADFPLKVVAITGFFLLLAIILSLIALAPRLLRNAIVRIDEDVITLEKQEKLDLHTFLLQTASITDKAGTIIAKRAKEKKLFTIFSAIFLALALLSAYILDIYAKTR